LGFFFGFFLLVVWVVFFWGWKPVEKWVPAYGMLSAYAFGYGAIFGFSVCESFEMT